MFYLALKKELHREDRLHRLEQDDVVVRLSLAELMMEAQFDNRNVCRRVVRLAEGVQNESEIHSALMLYQSKALRELTLREAARDVLTKTLRRKKDRSEELLRAIRYERAIVYEELGHRKRARSELETLYAEAPDYEDVAARLGL